MTVAEDLFARRAAPLGALSGQVDALVAAAEAMALRFATGGRLLALGAAADAEHVAVEFLHPVIVGKRALPALSLAADAGTLARLHQTAPHDVFAHQVRVLGRPSDIVLALHDDPGSSLLDLKRGLAAGEEQGMLTVLLVGRGSAPIPAARHTVVIDSDDPLVVKELLVTGYHLLWELVHVFLDDVGVEPRSDPALALYPFLGGTGSARTSVDVAASCRAKLADLAALREDVARDQAAALDGCIDAVAQRMADGATLLAFGNGGSSTDTQDVVTAFLAPRWGRPLPALGLTNDVAVVTALSNDVSFEVVFARQLAALARPGDVALGISTSGGSANVLAGLTAAAELGLLTVGIAGHDGGPMGSLASLQHLLVVPSSSVHRVQEVQTTLYHALWEGVQSRLAAMAS